MKLKDLFEQQVVIKGDVYIPPVTTLVGYKHHGIPIAGAVVTGHFNCASTRIKSLEGSPSRVDRDFNCVNVNLHSLEGVSEFIGGNLYCGNTKIETLHNIHKQIKHIGKTIYLPAAIKSHILGVMRIKGLEKLDVFTSQYQKLKKAVKIINTHLEGDRNIHECQEELLEAGLKEFAKL